MNSTEFFSNSNPAIGIIRQYPFLQLTKFEASLLQTHMYTLTSDVNQNLGQMMSIENSNKEHGFSHHHHIRHCDSV
jgi:hypothetical protein